jgi:hypothetical protein
MGARSQGNDGRPTAVDFATHTVHGDRLSAGEREECVGVIRELAENFAPRVVLDALWEVMPEAQRGEANASEVVQSALRTLCVLVQESDRPRLTAILVGRLVKLDLAAGKRLSYRQLGRANNISKQAVANRAKLYAERLGLPRLDSTEEARESARMCNRRNYGGVSGGAPRANL